MSNPKNQQDILNFIDQCELEDGKLKSKTLWSMSATQKYNKWQIVVGLKDNDTDENVDIELDMIIDRMDVENKSGYYYTISSVEGGKERISAETVIQEGKNIGKKNETTPLTQAVYQAMSLYDKRIKKGSSTDKKTLIVKGSAISIPLLMKIKQRGEKPWRVHAMALHDFAEYGESKIETPFWVQTKLDGTRFIVVWDTDLPLLSMKNGEVKEPIDGYSRGRETYESQEHILIPLAALLKKLIEQNPELKGLHLDGELWKKGYGLQDISGTTRQLLDSKRKKILLDYYIFDCFLLEKPELKWTERMVILDKIKALAKDDDHLKVVENKKINSKEELKELFQKYTKEGYEGAVVRDSNSLYEFDPDKERRSYYTLKYKERPDKEWPVIGFNHGEKGKAVDAVKWACMTTLETIVRDGGTKEIPPSKFIAVPNWPDSVKSKVLALLTDEKDYFEKNLKGKMVTIQYSILSKTFVPQQPKMLYFKDQEVEKKLLEDADEHSLGE
jgi:ATP-dependent DNA ligase